MIVKVNREKLGEHYSIVKTPSESNAAVQPEYVDLISTSQAVLLNSPKTDTLVCNCTSYMSGSGPEGMHKIGNIIISLQDT